MTTLAGDGVTDDTAALQEMLDRNARAGRMTGVPQGSVIVQGTEREVIEGLRRGGFDGQIVINNPTGQTFRIAHTPSEAEKAEMAWLKELERRTLERTSALGRHDGCLAGCRMSGKKCPPEWCEAHYQNLRKEVPRG